MNDIVERLRSSADDQGRKFSDFLLFREAADEIERLRIRLRTERAGIYVAGDAPLDSPGRRNAFESLVEKEEGCDSP